MVGGSVNPRHFELVDFREEDRAVADQSPWTRWQKSERAWKLNGREFGDKFCGLRAEPCVRVLLAVTQKHKSFVREVRGFVVLAMMQSVEDRGGV